MIGEFRSLSSRVALYGLLTVASVVVLVPVGWLFSTAFKNDTELFTTPPRWIPEEPTLAACARVWTDYPFLQYFQSSIVAAGSPTVIAAAFSALAGYGTACARLPGRGAVLGFR